MAMIHAGVAKVVVTPPVGVQPPGAPSSVHAPFVDVHDDLFVHALVLRGDDPGTAGTAGTPLLPAR